MTLRRSHAPLAVMVLILLSRSVLASEWYDPSKEDELTLREAIEQSHMPRLRSLLEGSEELKGSDEYVLPAVAVYEGSYKALRLLLEYGADPDPNPDLIWRELDAGFMGPTRLLSRAAWSGYANIVQLLLAAGADPNLEDRAHATPLHWAAFQGNVPTVEVLLAAGADVSARTDYGATPLHFAAQGAGDQLVKGRNEAAIIAVLLAAGADVSATTDPRTPDIEEQVPTFAGKVEEEWHKMPHVMPTGEKTALHLLANGCGYSLENIKACMWVTRSDLGVRVLLEAGADKYRKDQFGESAVSYIRGLECFLIWCPEKDDRYYLLTGKSRQNDDSASGWGVAVGVFAGFAAQRAGMSEQEAAEVVVEAKRDTENNGVQSAMLTSFDDINRQLAKRQQDMIRTQADLQRTRTQNTGAVQETRTRPDRENLRRVTAFERCIYEGNDVSTCARRVRDLTPQQASGDTDIPKRKVLKSTIADLGTATYDPDTGDFESLRPGATDEVEQGSDASTTDSVSTEAVGQSVDEHGETERIRISEALTVCWQNSGDKWFCSGPTQETFAAEDTEAEAIGYVGCDHARKVVEGVEIYRDDMGASGILANLHLCGKPLRSYDHDVRDRFEIDIPAAVIVYRYMCRRLTDDDSWDAFDCVKGAS